jgi:hypothetical protein
LRRWLKRPPILGMMAGFTVNSLLPEAVMGSTATEDALAMAADKGKNDSGKAGTARQAVARKSPAGKKVPGKKATSKNSQTAVSRPDKPATTSKQSAGKPPKKTRSATTKPVQPEQVATSAGSETSSARTATTDAVSTNAANNADTRSISWMSAQAVSALNAVKASQARKAESLLARVEKPVPGRVGITELPEQTSDDLLEEVPGMEAAAEAVLNTPAPQETTTGSPAAAGDKQTNQKEVTVMQDKPVEQETSAAAAGNTTETAAPEVPATTDAGISPGPEATASMEAVVASQAQPHGLPVRAIVMTVFLALLAFGGYRYWQDNRDNFVAAPPATGTYSETTQSAAWDDVPQQEAIAVVGTTTGEQSGPTATVPETTPGITAQPDTTAGNGLVTTTSMEPAGSAASEETGLGVAQPAAGNEPPEAAQAELKTPEPAEATASEPPQPQAPAVVAPPAPAVQPQPRYGAPGYGYYPQQPNWQQPYYQPGYPQQYPPR